MSLLGWILGGEEQAEKVIRATGTWPYLERFAHWLSRLLTQTKDEA